MVVSRRVFAQSLAALAIEPMLPMTPLPMPDDLILYAVQSGPVTCTFTSRDPMLRPGQRIQISLHDGSVFDGVVASL